VVSSSIGCGGLDVTDGENILIADTPEEFAEKTSRLLDDLKLRQSISIKARQLVENQYDWDILANRLMDILAEVTGCT
jgi:glycosyltransferase involved in cell wall biosynthesis